MAVKSETHELYIRIKMASDLKYGSVNKMLQSCNLSKSTVSNIKSGSMPSSDKLNAIADALDVTADWLLTGENPDGNGLMLSIDRDAIERAIDKFTKNMKKEKPQPSDDRWLRYEAQIKELPAESQERLMKQFQKMIEVEKELNQNQ